nr:dihydropteroate synthase [Allobaculum sp. Allo2]
MKNHPLRPAGKRLDAICSDRLFTLCDGIQVVGERINPTGKKRMQKALSEEDFDFIARLAIEQKEAGANILDVNVGAPDVDEVRLMPLVIRTIQSVCDLPLLLDSSNPKALEAGLRQASGRCAVNSVNGSQKAWIPFSRSPRNTARQSLPSVWMMPEFPTVQKAVWKLPVAWNRKPPNTALPTAICGLTR